MPVELETRLRQSAEHDQLDHAPVHWVQHAVARSREDERHHPVLHDLGDEVVGAHDCLVLPWVVAAALLCWCAKAAGEGLWRKGAHTHPESRRMKMSSTAASLQSLPRDLLLHTAGCLSSVSLLSLARVCRAGRAAAEDDQVWRALLRQHMGPICEAFFDGELPAPAPGTTWKRHFFSLRCSWKQRAQQRTPAGPGRLAPDERPQIGRTRIPSGSHLRTGLGAVRGAARHLRRVRRHRLRAAVPGLGPDQRRRRDGRRNKHVRDDGAFGRGGPSAGDARGAGARGAPARPRARGAAGAAAAVAPAVARRCTGRFLRGELRQLLCQQPAVPRPAAALPRLAG
eukprot:1154797-Prymnesium_polylepis.2